MKILRKKKDIKKAARILGVSAIIVCIGLTTYLVQRYIRYRKKAEDINRVADFLLSTTTGGSSAQVAPGEQFVLDLALNTGGKDVVGIDVILDFDATKVQLTGITPNTSSNFKTFLPVDVDGVFAESSAVSTKSFGAANFDWAAGTVTGPVNGSAVPIAQLTFSALANGQTDISIDFQGETGTLSTQDSNVVEIDTVNNISRDVLRDPALQDPQVSVIQVSVQECGDGILDPGEDCDGSELGGSTCQDFGFDEGTLTCSLDCTYDTSLCTMASQPASLYFDPDIYTASVGSSFTVKVMVDTGGEAVNALTTDFTYPVDKLEVLNIDSTNSTFGLTVEEVYSSGTVFISRGYTPEGGGFTGVGEVATIQFSALSLGQANLNFTTDAVVANTDSVDVLGGTGTGIITIEAACGDGTVQGGEECDGTNLNGQNCITLGYEFGALSCNADCTYNTSLCFSCGDGSIDGEEECEGTNLNGNTCVTLGYDGGTLSCGDNCRFDTSQCYMCGDGIVVSGEACDDGGTASGDGCSSTCQVESGWDCTGIPSVCSPVCGDSVVVGGEVCDSNSQSCTTGGYAGTQACNSQCSGWDACQATESCGDGTINGPEECDGTSLANKTCSDFGFMFGNLACSAGCLFDTSGCSQPSPYDINGPEGVPDGLVNIFDLSVVLSNWKWQLGLPGQGGDERADINDDTVVNIFDVSLILGHWDPGH